MRINKKAFVAFTAALLCLALGSCGGSSAISGDPTTFSNADESFSIELPASGEDDWTVNEETTGDVLDISNKDDTVNIQIQCLSKSQAQYIAEDLAEYEQYSMINTLSDILGDITLEDAQVELPDFITSGEAETFTLDDGSDSAVGIVIFMESESCYYTYLIMATKDMYDENESVLMGSVLSLQELTSVPESSDSES